MWLDVRGRAGEQQAIEGLQQGRRVDQLIQRRNHQRHTGNRRGTQVLVTGDVEAVMSDLLGTGRNADQRLARHGILVVRMGHTGE